MFTPRIRSVLLAVNLVILFLPLLGIRALRLYENELVHRTETSLIGQGSVLREIYIAEYQKRLGPMPDAELKEAGHEAAKEFQLTDLEKQAPYQPIMPKLDIYRERIREPALPAEETSLLIDPVAKQFAHVLNDILKRSQRSTLVGIRIVDSNGIVVASTGGESGLSITAREEVYRSLRGENVSLIRKRVYDFPYPAVDTLSRGTGIRIFVALPVIWENRVLGAIILSRTPMDIAKAMYFSRYSLIGYGIGLIVLVLLVSYFTATTISKPLEQLIAQTKRVRDGDYDAAQPLDKSGAYEIAMLSRSISEMAKTLKERANYIENFARNVSHEFKTPIASIQGTVELLTDHHTTMAREEKERFLDMLRRDALRMEALVNRLMELARADMAQPSKGGDVNVTRALRDLAQAYRDANFHLSLDYDENEEVTVQIAPEIFHTAINNLIENARHHGGPDVRVELRASLVGEPKPVSVVIDCVDNGPGVSKSNQAKIFDAFFTTARDTGRTGLGLAIVNSLMQAHGGTIELVPTTKGCHFRLTIPLMSE